VSRDLLNELARKSPSGSGEVAELVRRATYFDHQVQQGGFGLLIFNLRGEGLEDVQVMLETLAAPITRSFYVRAIERCVQDMDAYQAFLKDYAVESETKDSLLRVSLDYYQSGVEFPDEILPWLVETSHHL
jgi:hypothetical protein